MNKDKIYKDINDNKFLLIGGSSLFFIISLPTIITLFYSDISCPIIDGVCIITSIIPTIKTMFVYFLIFLFWYIITSKLVLPPRDKFEHTKQKSEDSIPKEYRQMTEPNLSVSNNTWNPASKDFWGHNPERKVNLLYYIAICGLLISFFGNYFGTWWILEMIFNAERWPLFHALILLLAIRTKIRPSKNFRSLLGVLIGWVCLKSFFYLLFLADGSFWMSYFSNVGVDIMNMLFSTSMTLLVWKQTQKKTHYGPSAKLFLTVVFSILIIRTIHDIWYIDKMFLEGNWLDYPIFTFIILLLHAGPLLFWVPFTLLYVYRTEIEPWEEITIPSPKDSTMNAYTANKLQEAKDLLDREIISMEEFLEIKKESIGSNEKPHARVPTIQNNQDIKTENKITNKDIKGGSSKMKELKELTEMKEKSLINDDEYEKMKKEIIG